jgi:hypothetical protein
VDGTEDCLFINVYIPGEAGKARKEEELLPVMFYIHGGGFFLDSGNADIYGPERFMDYDVVCNLLYSVITSLSASSSVCPSFICPSVHQLMLIVSKSVRSLQAFV